MRKIFTFYIPVILVLLQLGLTFALKYGLINNNNQSNSATTIYPFGIAFAILILFIVNQWFKIQKPYNKFKAFERSRSALLDTFTKEIIERYNAHDLRLNVMIAKRNFYKKLEPKKNNPDKKKKSFFCKTSQIVWKSNMDYDADENLELTVNQGVCGLAFQEGQIKTADMTVEKPNTYNLNKEQIDKTKELKVIISCPIFQLNYDTIKRTAKRIGVVNIDSKKSGSEIIINDTELRNQIIEDITKISGFCSIIY